MLGFFKLLSSLNPLESTFLSITKVEILDRYNMQNLKTSLKTTTKIKDFLKVVFFHITN